MYINHLLNGHFRILNWRYLPYIRPIFQAYVRGYPHKIWPEIWYSTSILGSWNGHWLTGWNGLILHGFSTDFFAQDWKQDGQISPETKKQVGKAINEISKDAWIGAIIMMNIAIVLIIIIWLSLLYIIYMLFLLVQIIYTSLFIYESVYSDVYLYFILHVSIISIYCLVYH